MSSKSRDEKMPTKGKRGSLIVRSSSLRPDDVLLLIYPTPLHAVLWMAHGLMLNLHKDDECGAVFVDVIDRHGTVITPEA
jgi:hypothetical protein